MQPAVPEPVDPHEGVPSQAGPFLSADDPGGSGQADVGAFAQGTPFSRWALARYLVGRAIASSVSDSLLVIAVVILALAAGAEWGIHQTWLCVLLVILAFGVFGVRWLVVTLMRRFTDARRYGPVEEKLRSLVRDTHRDVLRELRRLGLPSHTLTLPLLAFRMFGRRRRETVERLRGFRTENAVPAARLDDLHMLLRTGDVDPGAFGGPGSFGGPGMSG